MPLKEQLKTIVERVDGGVGAVVMGYDGIAIDEYINDTSTTIVDVPLLAVEYATVLKDIKRTVDVLKIGEMEEVCISSGFLTAIIRVIDDGLFAVLALSSQGNFGKGRYLLKLQAPQLRQSLL